MDYWALAQARVVQWQQNHAVLGQRLTNHRNAEIKAEALLESWLSPTQLEEYKQFGHFHVIGSRSKRRYRVTTGYSYNILEVTKSGEIISTYCAVLDNPATMHRHPQGDQRLAQKVMLETNEPEFLKIANRTIHYRPFRAFCLRLFAKWL